MSSLWLAARGAGLATLVLLSMSTALGAFVSRHGANGPNPNPARRYLVQYLHRVFGGLGLGALALHIGSVLADPVAHVGWLGALIPFASGYRPLAVALGSIALYTLIGVSVLGLARERIASSPRGARAWRWLHGLAYFGWAGAVLHGFTAGTDTAIAWVHALYIGCLVAVLAALATRLLSYRPGEVGDRFAHRLPSRLRSAPR